MFLRGSTWCGLVLTISLLGCDAQTAKDTTRTGTVSPPGVLPVGFDPQEAGRAAPQQQPQAQPQVAQGMIQPAGQFPQPMPQFQPQPQAQPQPVPSNDGKGIINKTTARVVEMQAAMAQNPNLKVVENKTVGQDPLTIAASAYVSARSQASQFPFQAKLKEIKVVEGRNPTYQEFIDEMKQHRLELTELYQWQMYGYDPQTGSMVILEDPVMKAERYRAAGIQGQ